MYNRWFSVAVILLWLSTMSWLVITKVVPPLLIGDPPSYRTILDARRGGPPVGWSMDINGKEMGWALCEITALPQGLTEVHSQVHFDELPLEQMAPDWLRVALKLTNQSSRLEMDAESWLVVDALGQLSRIESLVRLDSIGNLIRLDGEIEGNQLKWEVKSGNFIYKDEAYLASDALVGDSLAPQTHLPGLRAGQTWTVPAYSPFRPPNNPIEILQATVEPLKSMSYNGRVEDVWLVEYRSDPGSGIGHHGAPRERLWVRRDGTVLRQQVRLFDATITFTRLPRDQAVKLGNRVERNRAKHDRF